MIFIIFASWFFISDNEDKFPGYDYYSWGTTERVDATLHCELKYPYEKDTAGVLYYEELSGSFSRQTYMTDGYNGSNAMYQKIIELYKTDNYTMYEESIDCSAIVTNLVS